MYHKSLIINLKSIFKVCTILSVILAMQVQFFASVVYGQEASSSASSLTPTSATEQTSHIATATSSAVFTTESPKPIENPFVDSGSIFSQNSGKSISSLLDNSLGTVETAMSAVVKQKSVIHDLLKKTFKRDEAINLTVNNATSDQIQAYVTDSSGTTVNDIAIDKSTVDTQTTVSLEPMQFGFKPGKYTIHVVDMDGTTSTQDFTWGVLAINFNKSEYTPGETSRIAMAVLDESGNMVCDAKVDLRLKNNDLRINDELSTENGKIVVNPQCLSHSFSLTPDYETSYQLQGTGSYDVTLTATTKNETYSIDDSIKVVDAVPFDVERVTATRIYPPNSYPVIFHIKANQDFTGTITEYAPASFTIQPYATGSGALNSPVVQTYDTSSLVIPSTDMQAQFGTNTIALGKPFVGDFHMAQGFGVSMTDPLEAPYYASFGLAGHDGLDFALPSGTPVFSTDEGTVSLAGDGAYGMTIVIDHAWGKSYYGHLSKTEVTAGQHVIKGQEIGLSGNSGHTTGSHLHFGIKPLHPNAGNGFYGKVDPMPYLSLSNSAGKEVLGVSTSTFGDVAMKVIHWNVSLKSGKGTDLAYAFKAPGISPQLYTLGPLTFYSSSDPASSSLSLRASPSESNDLAGESRSNQGEFSTSSNNNLVFQEARLWQLAIDANSTAGPNNCGAAANVSISGVVWTTTTACSTGGTASTTGTVSSANNTDELKITTFGFSIPTNSKIIGISFSINRWAAANGAGKAQDFLLRDVKGGIIDTGNDHSAVGSWPTAAGTPQTYGSASDLWGNTWTYSDINSSGFGVMIAASGTSSTKPVTPKVSAFVTATITYDQPPNAPSNLIPNDTATGQSTTPQFQTIATDAESDALQYKITIWSGSCGGTLVQTDDESSSQTGWTGQNATCTSANDCYASDGITRGTFNTQSALAGGTTYYWKASALDPKGSNSFTDASSCSSFTTASSGPTLDQLLRHGEWFNNGVSQPFTF